MMMVMVKKNVKYSVLQMVFNMETCVRNEHFL
jgi:hypothetical protein